MKYENGRLWAVCQRLIRKDRVHDTLFAGDESVLPASWLLQRFSRIIQDGEESKPGETHNQGLFAITNTVLYSSSPFRPFADDQAAKFQAVRAIVAGHQGYQILSRADKQGV